MFNEYEGRLVLRKDASNDSYFRIQLNITRPLSSCADHCLRNEKYFQKSFLIKVTTLTKLVTSTKLVTDQWSFSRIINKMLFFQNFVGLEFKVQNCKLYTKKKLSNVDNV